MHQLELITDLLGTPGEGELHFITNVRARGAIGLWICEWRCIRVIYV